MFEVVEALGPATQLSDFDEELYLALEFDYFSDKTLPHTPEVNGNFLGT